MEFSHNDLMRTENEDLRRLLSMRDPKEIAYFKALHRTKPIAKIVSASLLIEAYMLGAHGWLRWIATIFVSIIAGSAVMVSVRHIIRKRFGYSGNMRDKNWMPLLLRRMRHAR